MATITSRDAAKICSKPELTLVKQSFERSLKAFTEKQLQTLISRTRKLRDKYTSEASRQAREMRGKADARGTKAATRNDRTQMKAELFDQALIRFEDKLNRLTSAPDPASKPTGRKAKASKKSAPAPATPAPAPAKATTQAPAAKKTKKKAAKKPAAKPAAKRAAKKTALAKSTPTLAAQAKSSPASSILTEVMESRKTRRSAKHQESKIGREQNRLAGGGVSRIRGHVSAQTRRRQAKRDSK